MNTNGYLGEFDVDIKDTPFREYTSKDWAEYWITAYGGIDGSHHKQWVIDQVMRILKGTPITIKHARWDRDGKLSGEWRVNLVNEPSEAYKNWIKEGEDDDYMWDEGIAP